MSAIAILSGRTVIYWGGLITALSLAAGLCLTFALYPRYNRHSAAVWVFFPFAVILGLFFSRVVYWYCHIELFPSFWDALLDLNRGGYALQGAIPGVWLAAVIVKRLGLVRRTGRLLDAVAPGLCLSFAFLRLGALFSGSCRSYIRLQGAFWQRLPFAVPETDAGGTVTWPLAAFFLSFLLLLAVTVVLVRFYLRYRRWPMADGSNPNGNVFRLFLLLWGLTEVLVDSLRNDACFFHFTWLRMLNPYVSFVKIGQLFAGFTILFVFLRFTVIRSRGRGFSWKTVLFWLLFLLGLVGAGFFGEYMVQRYHRHLLCYGVMIASLVLLGFVVLRMYRDCEYREEDDADAV